MVLSKKEKQELAKKISTEMLESKGIAFLSMKGLTVNDATSLRNKLREQNIGCKVVKNTLLVKAAQEAKIELSEEMFSGNTVAMAYSKEDEVMPNKVAYEFSKTNEAVKLIGAITEQKFMDKAGALALAQLPGRDELYAKVVGSISAPLSGLVNVLSGNMRGLVSVLKQYSEKKA